MITDLYLLGTGFKRFLNQNEILAKYEKEKQNFKFVSKN
jgi:hypothetical protein